MPENIAAAFLDDALPDNPLVVVSQWLTEARERGDQPNPNAMTLATVNAHGQPSARIVLCKGFDANAGTLQFFTNYRSQKSQQLAHNARVAVVFHWDHQGRQVRLEGIVRKLDSTASDQYFASRARESQIGAWASDQSEPIDSRQALLDKYDASLDQFDSGGQPEVPRPPHWGGFRIHIQRCELWVEGAGRVHDRAQFDRQDDGRWQATRLQP
ncbi:MAG: pyridoxamine 5'-phosphate oxidase [Pseudomonadota bacterium]